ncbi:MAG: hypothetical protein JSV47_09260 [Deltaproteobacteria bacterium]|nr:MAG: hypothetical protein JSV47_09260 [Deltaproteobacteria bacterium]
MALAVKIGSCFGVLEYWRVGKTKNPEFQLELVLSFLHYSSTPSLQQTAAKGERPLKPPQGAAQSRVPLFFTCNLPFSKSGKFLQLLTWAWLKSCMLTAFYWCNLLKINIKYLTTKNGTLFSLKSDPLA